MRLISRSKIGTMLLFLLAVSCWLGPDRALAGNSPQIKVKEYNFFHDLLHPLEHDALPAKDFQRIRTSAGDLVKRGKAIVKLGVPQGTAEKNIPEFRKELRKFNDALKQLERDAKKGTDTQLETSFSSVHDSFEMLLGMIG